VLVVEDEVSIRKLCQNVAKSFLSFLQRLFRIFTPGNIDKHGPRTAHNFGGIFFRKSPHEGFDNPSRPSQQLSFFGKNAAGQRSNGLNF